MKKILLLLTGLLALAITGCVNASVSIPYDTSLQDVVVITPAELTERLEQGTPFLLYISSVTCLSCAEFRPVLIEYIKQTGLTVLKIEADGTFPPENESIQYQYTPTLVLHDGEKVIFHINALDDPKPFSSLEQLTRYLNQHIKKN